MSNDSKYHIGQVVRINTAFYQTKERRGQRYQAIVEITPWLKSRGYGLRFANGDECHEKWVTPLTKREAACDGRRRMAPSLRFVISGKAGTS